MIKRIGLALLLLLIGLLLPSPNYFIGDKNKTYDNEFINSLAKGLNNRWGIVYLNDKDKVKDKDKEKESIKDFRDYIDCELIEIDKYNNRNFKDPKLKEFANAYINIVDTIKPENFEVENVSRSHGNEKRYIGNFENTTGYDIRHIYLSIHFYDEKDEGVFSIVGESEDVWRNGTKKSFEFPIYDSDKEFKYFKVFIGKKSLRLNRKGYSLEY